MGALLGRRGRRCPCTVFVACSPHLRNYTLPRHRRIWDCGFSGQCPKAVVLGWHPHHPSQAPHSTPQPHPPGSQKTSSKVIIADPEPHLAGWTLNLQPCAWERICKRLTILGPESDTAVLGWGVFQKTPGYCFLLWFSSLLRKDTLGLLSGTGFELRPESSDALGLFLV